MLFLTSIVTRLNLVSSLIEVCGILYMYRCLLIINTETEMFEQFAPYSFRATPARISCGLDGEPLNADAFDPQVNNDKDNGYKFEIPGQSKTKTTKRRIELQDDELILMSPRVYGFSLGDRKWCMLSIYFLKKITDVLCSGIPSARR